MMIFPHEWSWMLDGLSETFQNTRVIIYDKLQFLKRRREERFEVERRRHSEWALQRWGGEDLKWREVLLYSLFIPSIPLALNATVVSFNPTLPLLPPVWDACEHVRGLTWVRALTNASSLTADVRAVSRWLPVKLSLNHGPHLSSQAEWWRPTSLASTSCLRLLFPTLPPKSPTVSSPTNSHLYKCFA